MCHLLKRKRRTNERYSPVARERLQRAVSTVTDTSAPEAWVETDVKFFSTFEKFLNVFHLPRFPSNGLKTESVEVSICSHVA